MIDNVNQDPIKGLQLLTDNKYYAINDEVIVTINLERGSHVTYIFVLGDGSSTTIQNPEMLAFKNPMTTFHSYHTPGNYTISVTAKNDISTKSAMKVITVQEVLSTIDVQYNNIVPFPPGVATFELSVKSQYGMSQMAVNWVFGNGKSTTEYIQTLGNVETHETKYQYFMNDIGPKSLTCIVSNALSTATYNGTLVVQQTIKDVKIELITDLVIQTGGIFHLTVSVTKGTDLNYYIDFGDNYIHKTFSKNYDTIEEDRVTTLNVSHIYNTPGYYFIYVEVYNNISKYVLNQSNPVNVQQYVNDLIVQTFGVVGTPGDVARFRIRYTGPVDGYPTEVTCNLYINNVFSTKIYVESFLKTPFEDLQFTLNDIYNTGIFPVMINCSNKLNNQVLSTSVQVQRKIDNVIFSSSKVNIAANDTVVFEILISSGSDVFATMNYGDGSQEDTIPIQGLFNSNQVFQFIHTYRIPGFFIPTVLIYNIVSRIIKSLETNVYEAITGVNLKRYYKLSDVSANISFGEGEHENIFPKEREVILETSYQTGNGLNFIMGFW